MRLAFFVLTICWYVSAAHSLNPDKQDFLNDCLLSAALHGQFDEIPSLLERGAQPNVAKMSLPFYSKKSAFHQLISQKQEGLVEAMLERGANAQDGLFWAAESDDNASLRIAALCIYKGASPFSIELLHHAIQFKSHGMVRFLIEQSANVSDGSLISSAIANNDVAMAELLIDHGADHNAEILRNYEPFRPSFYAYYGLTLGINYIELRRLPHGAMQALLERYGVDRNLPCFRGKSLNEWDSYFGDKHEVIIWDQR